MNTSFFPDKAYLRELRRPWKIVTFSIGMTWLFYGALSYSIADWDVGISLIMGGITYLCAPWSVQVIYNAMRYRPSIWPLHIIAAMIPAVLAVDWSYWLYHRAVGNQMFRWENFKVSMILYFICGLLWCYRGSMRDFARQLRKSL